MKLFLLMERKLLVPCHRLLFDIYDFELCLMMFKGATIVLLDSSLGVFPARLLEELQNKEVNFIFWVPTIMVNIAKHRCTGKTSASQVEKRMVCRRGISDKAV